MSAPPYYDELVSEVAADVRATLDGAPTHLVDGAPQGVTELVDEVFALGASLEQAFRDRRPEPRRLPVCKPGCDSCCRLHTVFVTPLEALRLAAFVRASMPVEPLVARLREAAAVLRALSVAERAAVRPPCPLLDDAGACGVHPARPLLCRGYNSFDRAACEAAFAAGLPSPRLPADGEQVGVHKSLFAALVAGGGLERDVGPLELVHGLLAALTTEDAEARWRAGERVFDPEACAASRAAVTEWEVFVARRGRG